jgi:16S rRNA processing protein RimM
VPSPARDLVCVAVVAAAHGLAGALRLRCFTEDPASVAAYGPVLDHTGRELFSLSIVGRARDGVIAAATGIATREAAEGLRGTELFVPRARLPEPPAEEFYHVDLIGLEAVGRDGRRRGKVVEVANYGAGDMIEIVADDGASLLVPFTRAAVPEIDLGAGRITVDPPVELVAREDAA